MIDQLDREFSTDKIPILICPFKVFAKERVSEKVRDENIPCKFGGELAKICHAAPSLKLKI